MGAEGAHIKGREGVFMAKSWLESTTRFQIHFTVYDSEAQVTLPLADGRTKAFDMRGLHIQDDGRTNRCPLYVEVKNCDTEGGQGQQYEQYLRDCYLAAAKQRQDGVDQETEFMWLTWHPFSLGKWSRLCTEEELRSALTSLDEALVDEDLIRALPARLWLVVLSRRQQEMTMGDRLLGEIRRILTAGEAL